MKKKGSYKKQDYPQKIDLPLGGGLGKNSLLLFHRTSWEDKKIEALAICLITCTYKAKKNWWDEVSLSNVLKIGKDKIDNDGPMAIIAELEEQEFIETFEEKTKTGVEVFIIMSPEFVKKTLITPAGESSLDKVNMMHRSKEM